jgi:hypothetical protein
MKQQNNREINTAMFISRSSSISILNTRLLALLLVFFVMASCGSRSNVGSSASEDKMQIERIANIIRVSLNDQICAGFDIPVLQGASDHSLSIGDAGGGWKKVTMRWELQREVKQDELAIAFKLAFEPDFWWSPHLAPSEGYVVGQHVFRAPAIIVQKERTTLVIAPDLDIVGKRRENPWFMDFDAPKGEIKIGMVHTDIPKHVLFRKKPGMVFSPGVVELGFYISAYNDEGKVRNPWKRVAEFHWERWGRPLLDAGEPINAPLDTYVEHTYNWAFDTWGKSVWQEFDIDGKRVGAPQFIVNISQSPNYPGVWYQREFLSIWNQAWFSSLRSASGLYRYAKRIGDKNLESKALMTKELALAAPMKDGLFPGMIKTDNVEVTIEGKKYRRPGDWDKGHWTNSNRRPWRSGVGGDWPHLLDSSWTCLLMLRWYEDLEKDPRLLKYCLAYGNKLVTLQDEDGFFPGWIDPKTNKPGKIMNQTPESSMSVTFLLKLSQLTGDKGYRDSAIKAMDALLVEVIPDGRWEDFETYWSCCGWGRRDYLGKKIERNDMYKQCSFSTFWTAEALLACYRTTNDKKYLDWGRRTLDELGMVQQVWQPPFIYVPALGGFGVMNTDGEWNDSRQTLFAELFMEYYKEMGDAYLFERGIAALKSGFTMMYCPQNPQVKKMWEKVYPWFGPEDYGFTMENYAHGGTASPEGRGMGTFTIYDWGNGAASEAANRIHDHYGDVYIDRKRQQAFGIDAVAVKKTSKGWELTDQAGIERNISIMYEDGTSRTLHLKGKETVR